MSVKVIDKLPSFKRSNAIVMNDALKEASRDILINAKRKAPHDKGGLRGESEEKSVGFLKRRVSFWVEYARFQEFGGDRKRRVRNYKHSGVGPHFLRNAGNNQAEKMPMTLAKHARRARV